MIDALLNSIDCQLAIINREGYITYVNQAWMDFARANGLDDTHQFIGTNYLLVCAKSAQDDDEARVAFSGLQAVMSGSVKEFKHEFACHSPTEKRWYCMRAAPIARHPGFFAVSHTNTTVSKEELISSQQQLHDAALHTAAVLNHMADGVITVNFQGLIETYNKAAITIFGYSQQEAIGMEAIHLMPQLLHDQTAGDAYLAGKPQSLQGQHKDGRQFPVQLSVSKIHAQHGIIYICIVRDVTQQRKDEEEIRRLAFFDPLTGLANRRLLVDRVKRATLTSSRTKRHAAMMFLDLDYFKLLNDTLGHDVGDELLQQVASRLRACVREDDTVARLGGDEFVVLLETLSADFTEAAFQSEQLAHKILEALGLAYNLRHHIYNCTPSIGVVVFIDTTDTTDDLIKKADIAMYQAKAAGRNTVRIFNPDMQAQINQRVDLEKDLRRGLEHQEFSLHYQVQVNKAGECIGAEALVRWNHEVQGMVSPAKFIPVAEETGVILTLGQWVLDSACAQLVEWSRSPETAHWTLAVNVSASQFSKPDFVDNVISALKRSGAKPELLKLELTESMLVNDVDDIISKMNAIKAFGVDFSLDDFGTGYSSLSYLTKLPLSQLKLDQSFVRDVTTNPSDAVIARTVVSLGHSLGLKVVAEGVENIEQRDFLTSIGCDAFQGFFFGRPTPADAMELPAKTI
jgi:diguanylate cyclase (GGDEF)-like protein/PAS domain S-box-containing protein